jgi:asparagine synthase (glutamine-hydrolysing)
MCGIAGLVGDFIPGLMGRMNAAQAHRGPDGRGVFERPELQVALGHVRLAILDLSDFAAQPMTSPCGRYVLVYNGEIYNFAELQKELSAGGSQPVSSGDTEVLLRGLMRWGSRFVERLNGMFAFALWDNREQELLLVRDPLGIKPLYYAEPVHGSILFASEIKAICAHPRVVREPDFHAIQQHLTFCHSCSDRTALRGIRRLEPGTMLRWKAATRATQITRFWQPSFCPETANAGRVADIERLREAVEAATERQLVSDVPVGSFLSGGLDSSLITAIAARRSSRSGPFRSYTISIPPSSNRIDQAHNDAPYARSLAALLGLDFEEIEIAPQVASLLPSLIRHMDEPLADPAIISCHLISQLARRNGTKVLLSGQGADELFGGYPRYAALRSLRWVDWVPVPIRTGLSRSARLLPGALSGTGGAAMRRIRRVLSDIDRPPDERFLAYCMSTPPEAVRSIFHTEVLSQLEQDRPGDDCRCRIQGIGLTREDRFLERDLGVYLPNHNLLYTDKIGMSQGVEVRVPLLDRDVVELACSLPTASKLAPRPKAILREAARSLVPDPIIDRPKAGFGAPFRHWLRHDLGPLWNDLTSPAAVGRRGWFSTNGLRRIREQSQSGRADYYMLQWAVLTLELWAREFLDRNPADVAIPQHTRRASERNFREAICQPA